MSDHEKMSLKWEWLAAPDVRAPELRATWAHLEIYVGAHCVTLVEDVESASSRRSIFVPLYPLAEWVAYNWWPLVTDTRPATMMARLGDRNEFFAAPAAASHRERHGLRGAGDGFLWPNLLILPEGSTTRLCWRPDRAYHNEHPIRYLTSGEAVAGSDEVQWKLRHLVDAVLARLKDRGIENTPLEAEWRTVQDADEGEAAYCVAAARLGLDPYSNADRYEESILAAARRLTDRRVLDDFLDAVEPAGIPDVLAWIDATWNELATIAPVADDWPEAIKTELRGVTRRTHGQAKDALPWDVGWRHAKRVREAMSLDDIERLPIEDRVPNVVRPAPSRSLHALGAPSSRSQQILVALARRQRPTARRFTLARSLWHLLGETHHSFLLTSAYTDRQRIERAFAAELLAPATGIAKKIDGDVIEHLDEDLLSEIAASYGVSEMVIRHQVDNQLIPA